MVARYTRHNNGALPATLFFQHYITYSLITIH